MANELKPLFRPGVNVTVLATAAVTGGRLVGISATQDSTTKLFKVAHVTAAAKPFGVASADIASGATGTVVRGGIVPLVASGAITAGAQVEAATGGKVATLASGVACGQALNTTAADGDVVYVSLDI